MIARDWARAAWSVPRLNAHHRLTLLALCMKADATGKAETTPREIAYRMIGCDLRTVQNAMRALSDMELVEVIDQRGGRGRKNTYRLTV